MKGKDTYFDEKHSSGVVKYICAMSTVFLLWISFCLYFPFAVYLSVLVLFLFGCYAIVNIAYHMFIFKECPEAYQGLLKDIDDAKKDLSLRGIHLKLDKQIPELACPPK